MKTINKIKIEQSAHEIYAKYYKTGIPAKALPKIMAYEKIKLREIDGGADFLGALIKNPKGFLYIAVNKNIENAGRKNFTAAHEFGHFVLQHHLQTASLFCGGKEITEDGEAVSEQEKEANYFASCYLLPRNKVMAEFTNWYRLRFNQDSKIFLYVKTQDKSYSDWKAISSKLTDEFGVSTAALKIRLLELDLINNF